MEVYVRNRNRLYLIFSPCCDFDRIIHKLMLKLYTWPDGLSSIPYSNPSNPVLQAVGGVVSVVNDFDFLEIILSFWFWNSKRFIVTELVSASFDMSLDFMLPTFPVKCIGQWQCECEQTELIKMRSVRQFRVLTLHAPNLLGQRAININKPHVPI